MHHMSSLSVAKLKSPLEAQALVRKLQGRTTLVQLFLAPAVVLLASGLLRQVVVLMSNDFVAVGWGRMCSMCYRWSAI